MLTQTTKQQTQGALAFFCLKQPQRAVGLFICIHVMLWILAPALLQPNAYLDAVESIVWGQEWQWGYHKHPSLYSNVLYLLYLLFDNLVLATAMASQLSVGLAFLAVWYVGKEIVGAQRALVAVLALEGIYYYNWVSVQFNGDILLLAGFAWMTLAFYKAVKNGSLFSWCVFGFLAGTCILIKYVTLVFCASFFLFMLTSDLGRRRLRTWGPYVAGIICIVVLWPHLVWLKKNNWTTVHYFLGRSAGIEFWWQRIFSPLRFSYTQLLVLAPVSFLMWPFRKHITAHLGIPSWKELLTKMVPWGRQRNLQWEHQLLATVAWGPIGIAIVIALLSGAMLHCMWVISFFSFVPLWFVAVALPHVSHDAFHRFLKRLLILGSVVWVAYGAALYGGPFAFQHVTKAHFPGQTLANVVTDEWRRLRHQPLTFVIGSEWEAGNVSVYSQDRPSVLLYGDYHCSPWINPTALKQMGGVIVWAYEGGTYKLPEIYATLFPTALLQPALNIAPQTAAKVLPLTFGWAIVLPESTLDYSDI